MYPGLIILHISRHIHRTNLYKNMFNIMVNIITVVIIIIIIINHINQLIIICYLLLRYHINQQFQGLITKILSHLIIKEKTTDTDTKMVTQEEVLHIEDPIVGGVDIIKIMGITITQITKDLILIRLRIIIKDLNLSALISLYTSIKDLLDLN
ncbi:hypothetical protein MRV_0109 [Murid herpesvirus 3]|uniref:Uncharacterized protein n=2 Tax=Murid betaherpesvirus 3 TaxID=2560603 RepID=A0A1P8VIZ1_9BETA|nr:hypothetical protein MRV_0109 [Murine roseolovirus]APZ76320.1 hypothetical protein MRV_0109 [Murid betaherpesvirus 3]AYH64798.1 hypothetical protein MRV_0109 [Murid herpesvirus 3]